MCFTENKTLIAELKKPVFIKTDLFYIISQCFLI